ncbi:alpha/beta hydrolase [Streptomyces sp. RFCAC02]|uniref:alpha/beta fold hydrolase n=1 Tax=Streptomyces sp. RFCAC02 TaxID=2499143 RepID=UPI0010204D00|nr:alpha/beta hydrolase [Streptomyces sp. RFCAC02]
MRFVTTRDGANLYYKDWGTGRPVVFLHGWPLNADAWDDQLNAVAEAGFRGVAHDRRGHGRSTQTWHGNDMDTWADDLAQIIETLDLRDITLVGHSMGGGELCRYISRHGTSRVRQAVLVAAVPPLMLRTETNPQGVPIDELDAIRQAIRADRAQFWHDLAGRFYSADDGAMSTGLADAFWFMAMHQGVKAALACVKEFSETDFTEDLRAIDVPALVVHGDDDRIVPLAATGEKAARIIPDATLTVYPGGSHGLPGAPGTKDRLTADLLAFLRA